MHKKQLAALFFCNLVLTTVGNGPFGLFAVYATRLGADPTVAGYLLSATFVLVTVGAFATGWLADKVQRRKRLLIIGGLGGVPTFWLMGQATNLVQLAVVTLVAAFFAGMAITMTNIMTGLFAEEAERGRVFGIIASTGALGALIGGLVSGPIADRWGFTTLYSVAAAFLLLHPLIGLLLEDKKVAPQVKRDVIATTSSSIRSRPFFFLFFASTIAFLTNSVHILGRPLMMDSMGFDATAISSTVAVAGLVTLPFPLLVGWLSDRFGRKPLIILCYLTNVLALVILAASVSVWHFWLSTAFQAMLVASIGVGSALVTDLVPERVLGRALSLFTTTNFIGFVIGFAATGNAIEHWGITSTLMVGASLALLAIILLVPVRQTAPHYAMETG